MRLVIGGAWQGKKEYVKRQYHIEESEIWTGGYPVAEGEWKCVDGLHNIIKMTEPGTVEDRTECILQYINRLIENNPDIILICDEVGGGIVPVDKADRDYRECVGRVLCELAGEADSVERVHCGIGQTIKRTVHIALLRHGATQGNLEKKYIGVTDEPLCAEGIASLEEKKKTGVFPKVNRVIASPMLRCIKTAEILCPDLTLQTEEAFRETDFGIFEGKNYEEIMADNALRDKYQAWIDSGGSLPFPGGESMEQTAMRCGEAFERLLPTLTQDTAMIVHGGTIMSILSTYATPQMDYYDYRCDNGAGYLCRVELTGDGKLYGMTIQKQIQ